jgi:hypothetical protein
VREDTCERIDHLNLARLVVTTFEVGLIHGVGIGLRFNAVVDDNSIGRMRVVTPFVRVCRCELVKSHMEGNTDLIVYI